MTRLRTRLIVVAVALLAFATLSSVSTSQAATAASVVHTCSQHVAPGHFTCYALRRADLGFTPKARYTPRATTDAPDGYGPSDLASAYDLPTSAGSGQRIYIIDAYDDPSAESDLAEYRTQYGLPACTTANGCFRKLNQQGGASPLPAGSGDWAGEIALDLDMVSAACPQCDITLMEADSDGDDLFTAVDTAVSLGAKFVSISWGSDEEYSDDPDYNSHFDHPGVVFSVASGDSGYGAGYPAASPRVVSVGGTRLVPAPDVRRGWTESVYNDPSDPSGISATGAGCSTYESKPGYQGRAIPAAVCSTRAENDVSAVADPRNGVAVYQTYGGDGWGVFGGTSASAPIIASVYALAGDPSTSFTPAKSLYYNTADLNDVTSGNDGTCAQGAQQVLCAAASGWDGPTGLGTPNGVGAFSPAAIPGDCELGTVTCRPADPPRASCTGYSSQTTRPSTIKVLVRTTATAVTIQSVNFASYVENVLPNEWPASWDGDALKAGAVAVKSYAWYWVTHFGGYLNHDPKQCFDVTDDQDFQVYQAGSATARTTSVVQQTWPVAARRNGRIVETLYRDNLAAGDTDSCAEDANGATMSQNGTQACNEASTGNKYNVILGKYYYPGLQLATAQQRRTQHDFQFLHRSTRVTFKAGKWWIDDGYPTSFNFGQSGDLPTVTNGGDGFARVGVYRPSTATWYVAGLTGTGGTRIHFGAKSDIPVQANYHGIDKATVLAVFRPATHTWWFATASGGVAAKTSYGAKGDIPVPGHYSGSAANHYADQIAVFRPSTGQWYVRGRAVIRYGQRGDIPVPADYDGNGTTDIAVYRPSTHRFYVRGHASVRYGVSGDVPVTGDFTGDGKADFALYRPSTHIWYVKGAPARTWGYSGVTPIGRAPYHD